MAGPTHVLNGGIIATIVDCHSICTAIADAYAREDRPIGSEPDLWFATAALEVTYVKPAPLAPLILRARVEELGHRSTRVACALFAGDDESAPRHGRRSPGPTPLARIAGRRSVGLSDGDG